MIADTNEQQCKLHFFRGAYISDVVSNAPRSDIIAITTHRTHTKYFLYYHNIVMHISFQNFICTCAPSKFAPWARAPLAPVLARHCRQVLYVYYMCAARISTMHYNDQ